MSTNFLSRKVCSSCPASVFAQACQINNIPCWVTGNKCEKSWVWDANPYGLISSLLYKGFSNHWIWQGHSKACGLSVRAACMATLRSCLQLSWGCKNPGTHGLPTSPLAQSAQNSQAGRDVLWGDQRHREIETQGVEIAMSPVEQSASLLLQPPRADTDGGGLVCSSEG